MNPMAVVGYALMGTGALFVFSGGMGLLIFPDFYTRIHAVSVTDSAGAGLILVGLLLLPSGWATEVRLLIILLFLMLTSPTATHVLAHAARRDGIQMWREGDRRR
ncbi:monovalent cation/H(+) antiporter subunit G [Mycolicibacterium sp. XJ870]